MGNYQIGDLVIVDVDIIGDDEPHMIIGISPAGYVVQCKHGGWAVATYNLEEFGIVPGHEGERAWLINERDIFQKVGCGQPATAIATTADNSSLKCGVCSNFFPGAQTNLADGGFACYSCRTDPRNMLGNKLLKR